MTSPPHTKRVRARLGPQADGSASLGTSGATPIGVVAACRTRGRPASPPRSAGPPARSVADVLLELGTEELPAAYLPTLIAQLQEEAATLVTTHHLTTQAVHSFGTPRRLVVLVQGVPSIQHTPAAEIRGPSKQASYDPTGQPTPALLGFLRAQGGTLTQITCRSTPKGEYCYLLKEATATPTARVLPHLLSQLAQRLRAPKTMRWDSSGLRFARPIRWCLSLYGTIPVRMSIGALRSGSITWIGGPTRPRAVPVRSIKGYFTTIQRAGIILERDTRRTWIDSRVTTLARHARGRPARETVAHGLLDEVTDLLERPVSLVGTFDRAYLPLPREVLLASMAKYQRLFAVERAGTLLPQFIAMLDGAPQRPTKVRAVIEHILNARLADSLLFWNEDHQHLPLDTMSAGCRGITFHERLGSMADKTHRLEALSVPLADAWQLTEEERAHLTRSCQLAKADLVSAMVREFPTLQGVMGKYYARDSNEPEVVACALEEQYLPSATSRPTTLIGSALALLDRYDTLTSYAGIGIMPTGDQDPFGLRRTAQGIVEIAWQVHRPLPLSPLFRMRATLDPFCARPEAERETIAQTIHRYLLERLYAFAWGPTTPSTACIDAVLSSPCPDLIDAMDRILSLQQLSGQGGLSKAAKIIERTRNILKGAALTQPAVDPSRLTEPQERTLWELYASHRDRVIALAEGRAYAEATTLFGEAFFEPLHTFFDHVLVNAPEPSLQQNRLALMQAIHTLYTDRIADLSKLVVQNE